MDETRRQVDNELRPPQEQEPRNRKELTPRAIIWGILIGILMLAIALYMLMMTGINFPAGPVAALMGIILMPLFGGKATKYEVNMVHTIASAVALSSTALIGTFTAAIISGYEFNWRVFLTILFLGNIIGLCFISILRKQLVEDPSLKFPGSIITKDIVEKAENPPKYELKLFIIFMIFIFVFSLCQKVFNMIPAQVDLSKFLPKGCYLDLIIMPMALGMGYILGMKMTSLLLIGALVAHLVLAPIGTSLGWFLDPQVNYKSMQDFNLSLVLGMAIVGSLVPVIKQRKSLINSFKIKTSDIRGSDNELPVRTLMIIIICAVIAAMIFYYMEFKVNPIFVLVTVLCMLIMSVVSIRATAEAGINFAEVFDMFLILTIVTLVNKPVAALLLVGLGTCMTSLGGDTISDFKTGQLIGASVRKQAICQFIGFIPGILIGSVIIYTFITTRGIGTAEAPFPFAHMYYGLANAVTGDGLGSVISLPRMGIGGIVGGALALLGLPATALALTTYLNPGFFIITAIGGFIRGFTDKKYGREIGETWTNAASGMMVGEGLVIIVTTILLLIK